MEFSKQYREELVTSLASVFKHNSGSNPQKTFFFSGEVPSHTAVHAAIRDEWHSPIDGVAKAPDNIASVFNNQYAGSHEALLSSCKWETVYEPTSVADRASEDVDASTAYLENPVALRGIYNAIVPVVVQGFDHELLGDTRLTWALTLWGSQSSNTAYRSCYVMHRIGTLLDPEAELVLSTPVLTTSDPVVFIDQIYSPVF